MRGLTTVPTPGAERGRPVSDRRSSAEVHARRARANRPKPKADPILVTKVEAARVLGMSVSHYQRHVQDQIRCVYSGQLTLYDYADLKRWATDEATIGGRTFA